MVADLLRGDPDDTHLLRRLNTTCRLVLAVLDPAGEDVTFAEVEITLASRLGYRPGYPDLSHALERLEGDGLITSRQRRLRHPHEPKVRRYRTSARGERLARLLQVEPLHQHA